MNRILTLVALLAGLFLSACSKDKEEELLPPAIQAIIDQHKDPSTCPTIIDLYSRNNEKIYVITLGGNLCDWLPGYADAEGKTITSLRGYPLPTFKAESKFIRHVWKGKLKEN